MMLLETGMKEEVRMADEKGSSPESFFFFFFFDERDQADSRDLIGCWFGRRFGDM